MTKTLFRALLVFCALPLLAQSDPFAETNPYKPLTKLPMGDVFLSLPSPNIPSQGTWEVKFTHRFNQSIDEGSFADRAHDLFGLDSNADVTFGVGYTPRRDLQLSLARSNTNDTFEAAAKWVFLQQAPSVPVSVSLRGGADWRTEENLKDRTSFFAQGIITKQFGRKVEVFALPTIATNAGRALDGDQSAAMFDHAFNMPVGFAYMWKPALAVVVELVPPNQDLADDADADLGWSIGLKRAIGGHWFEVLLTNSQSTMVDQYVTSTFQGAPLDSGDIHLGFNIERRFGGRRR
ncbi:MAG TPA: DUF5777 family beta-barrel protein [Thermoanaerobaculia bacterium]|nr:DUF5777 family beta-barrel protein [Thermoanaerobaculia bacterium]